MPAGIRWDHRTDVPLSDILHVVFDNATHQALKRDVVKIYTMAVIVGMTPNVICHNALWRTPWTRGVGWLGHIVDAH
eukprot:1853828-Amphidinium_carterae.1